MAFVVCTVPGEQTKHGLDTVAAFQTAGGVAVGIGWDFGIVLAVGGKAHDVIPIEVSQLWQMIMVKAGIVCEDGMDIMLLEPGSKISNSLSSSAENRLYRRLDKQGAFIHTADLTLDGQDMIFSGDKLKSVRICYDGADTHDLVCLVGFCVDDSEFAHVFLS